ncbi:N-6 DNA methylase (plasmid) [Clostridium perfringens]|uniref:N-6 DNA methylase n=1 Tax=Clostridium perfringens TaxID=1502 RepID=UPI00096A99C3|nr:N-6 DNA methylase [Clostridium perfringens]
MGNRYESEELIKKNYEESGLKIHTYEYYSLGESTLNQLASYNIIPNVDYKEYSKRKPDGLLVDRRDKDNIKVVAVEEYKKREKFKTEADIKSAIEQCNDLAQELNATIGIITDGDTCVWINPKEECKENEYEDRTTGKIRSYNIIHGSDKQVLTQKFFISERNHTEDYEQLLPETKSTLDLIEKIIYSINKKNSIIIDEESSNPTDLAKKVWQDLWAASGAKPEECLYTFVELFIFKFLSDLKILKSKYTFSALIKDYKDKEINDEDVLDSYCKDCRNEILRLFPASSDDGTAIISKPIFVDREGNAILGYSTLFKNIIFRFKDYGELKNIDKDFKSKLFESFLKQSISKKEWGQFFTPRKVVRAIVDLIDLKEGMTICDPAGGVGKFVLEPMVDNPSKFFELKDGKIVEKIKIRAFDKSLNDEDEKTISLAKANMAIYNSEFLKKNPDKTKEFSNYMNTCFKNKSSILGTLDEVDTQEDYDIIVANFPYVTSGVSNIKNEIKNNSKYSKFYSVSGIGLESLFLEWSIRKLKKGTGRAYLVIPDGILNRINDKKMREFILKNCSLDALISLPINTFYSTPKKTYIMILTRKSDKDKDKLQRKPVFTYIANSIGETLDNLRFDIEDNDLSRGIMYFKMYDKISDTNAFEEMIKDKKCKIFEAEIFKNNIEKHWIIDRWWSDEEKVELGIIEQDEVKSIEEFYNQINDTIEKMRNISNSIKSEFILEDNKREQGIKEGYLEDIVFEKVSLEEIVDFNVKTNNSKFTKTFVQENKGDIPVYSASKNPDLIGYGKIKDNLEGIQYFEDCLTWNIDGSIGKVHYRKGRFSLSEKVIPLKLKIRYKINEKAIKILREKYCTENNKDRFILIHNKLIDNEKELKQLCNLYGLNIKLSSNVAKEVIKVCNKIDYNFYLDKEYLKYEIEKATSILGFEYSNKAGKSKISKVEIKIPFNVKTELPDKKIQSIIGIKYKKIDEYNKQLNEMLKEIKNIKVDL